MAQILNKKCPLCGEYVYLNNNGDEICTGCGYVIQKTTYMTAQTIGVGKIEETPYTLQIDTDLIRLKHKEMELEFELEPRKLENIDTIILNGYKYVKEK